MPKATQIPRSRSFSETNKENTETSQRLETSIGRTLDSYYGERSAYLNDIITRTKAVDENFRKQSNSLRDYISRESSKSFDDTSSGETSIYAEGFSSINHVSAENARLRELIITERDGKRLLEEENKLLIRRNSELEKKFTPAGGIRIWDIDSSPFKINSPENSLQFTPDSILSISTPYNDVADIQSPVRPTSLSFKHENIPVEEKSDNEEEIASIKMLHQQEVERYMEIVKEYQGKKENEIRDLLEQLKNQEHLTALEINEREIRDKKIQTLLAKIASLEDNFSQIYKQAEDEVGRRVDDSFSELEREHRKQYAILRNELQESDVENLEKIEKYEETIKSLKEESEKLKNKYNLDIAARDKYKDFRESYLNSREEKIKDLEKQSAEKSRVISEKEEKIRKQKSDLNELDSAFNKRDTEARDAESTLKALQNEIATLKQKKENSDKELINTKDRERLLLDEKQYLSEEKNKYLKEVRDYKRILSELQETVDLLTHTLSEAQKEVAENKAEKDEAIKKLKEIKLKKSSELETMEEATSSLTVEYEILKTQVEMLNERQKSLFKEKSKLSDENIKLSRQILSLEKDLEKSHKLSEDKNKELHYSITTMENHLVVLEETVRKKEVEALAKDAEIEAAIRAKKLAEKEKDLSERAKHAALAAMAAKEREIIAEKSKKDAALANLASITNQKDAEERYKNTALAERDKARNELAIMTNERNDARIDLTTRTNERNAAFTERDDARRNFTAKEREANNLAKDLQKQKSLTDIANKSEKAAKDSLTKSDKQISILRSEIEETKTKFRRLEENIRLQPSPNKEFVRIGENLSRIFDSTKASDMLFGKESVSKMELEYYKKHHTKIHQDKDSFKEIKGLNEMTDREIGAIIKEDRENVIKKSLPKLVKKLTGESCEEDMMKNLSSSDIAIALSSFANEEFEQWKKDNQDKNIAQSFCGNLKEGSEEQRIRFKAINNLIQLIENHGVVFGFNPSKSTKANDGIRLVDKALSQDREEENDADDFEKLTYNISLSRRYGATTKKAIAGSANNATRSH